jgi:hypothetical protein
MMKNKTWIALVIILMLGNAVGLLLFISQNEGGLIYYCNIFGCVTMGYFIKAIWK